MHATLGANAVCLLICAAHVTSHLGDKGVSALVVVLPAFLTGGGGHRAQLLLVQVRRRVVAGEARGVPVQVVPFALAACLALGAVDQGGVVPRVVQTPAAALPCLGDAGITAPVLRGEALKDDAHVDARPGHGHHAQKGEDALLAAAELAGLLQDVVKSGHGCSSLPVVGVRSDWQWQTGVCGCGLRTGYLPGQM